MRILVSVFHQNQSWECNMVIDSLECCYCKVMLCYEKLQNDIWLSAASMLESVFAPESTITKQFEHAKTASGQPIFAKTASGQPTFNCENSTNRGERQDWDRKQSISPFCSWHCWWAYKESVSTPESAITKQLEGIIIAKSQSGISVQDIYEDIRISFQPESGMRVQYGYWFAWMLLLQSDALLWQVAKWYLFECC